MESREYYIEKAKKHKSKMTNAKTEKEKSEASAKMHKALEKAAKARPEPPKIVTK